MPFQSVMVSWIIGVRARGMFVAVGLGVVRYDGRIDSCRERVFG